MIAISCDLTKSYSEIQEKFDDALKSQPPVDILVNNAGGSIDGPFDQLPVDTFEDQMKFNYLSSIYVTRYFIQQMKERAPKIAEGKVRRYLQR